jgi:hypothetical protein
MNNTLIHNNNGAIAYQSTNNYLLDLFTWSSKKFPIAYDEFVKLVMIINNAMKQDPITFLRLIKFHRLVKNGNGIKIIYYLSMVLLKYNSEKDYEYVLKWSYQYPKDLLVLHRLTNMFKPLVNTSNLNSYIPIEIVSSKKLSGTRARKLQAFVNCNVKAGFVNVVNSNSVLNSVSVPVQIEIFIYAKLICDMLKDMFEGNNTNNINPMLLKYLSYGDGHWSTETKLIFDLVEYYFFTEVKYRSAVNSDIILNNKLASDLRDLIKPRLDEPIIFTNKVKRLIKKLFNETINLLDNLYKGVHSDKSLFFSHNNEQKEIKMICDSIKKTPTLSYERFEKTLRKYDLENMNKNQKLLYDGYQKYLVEIKNGKTTIKTHGSSITDAVWDFFTSNKTEDISIEAKLIEMAKDLKNNLEKVIVGQMNLEEIGSKIILLLDISGSMNGTPINTGLLYFTLMAHTFKIKNLYYFETDFNTVSLTDSDLNGTMCNLVRKIYKFTQGSTNLECAFKAFEQLKLTDKNIMIITDGDCDPGFNESNPFKTATVKSPKNIYLYRNNFIIVNVKESKLNFPYLNLDPNVCYISGNNPKTINGFIKALLVSIQNNKNITPDMVLKYSLELEELYINKDILELKYDYIMLNDELECLYNVINKNLPKKNI